jgi:hypothetical protein
MCGTIVPYGHCGLPCGAVGLRAYVDLSMSCFVHLLTKFPLWEEPGVEARQVLVRGRARSVPISRTALNDLQPIWNRSRTLGGLQWLSGWEKAQY